MSLKGKTLGIWGYGKIGQLVAKYGLAFDMRVIVWGSNTSRQKACEDGLEVATTIQDFFSRSDVLSLHLRLHDATRGIVKSEMLAHMKPTALLVNTSRAELIEPNALLTALNRGRPGMAAIDVYEFEPHYQDKHCCVLKNCICTPHIGYVEQDNYELYFAPRLTTSSILLKAHPAISSIQVRYRFVVKNCAAPRPAITPVDMQAVSANSHRWELPSPASHRQ